ncbi:MAG: hypothetical protein AAF492_05340, partial [Verrucomicrobiota bacterium]
DAKLNMKLLIKTCVPVAFLFLLGCAALNFLDKESFFPLLKEDGIGPNTSEAAWNVATSAGIQVLVVFALGMAILYFFLFPGNNPFLRNHHIGVGLMIVIMSFELVKAGMAYALPDAYKEELKPNVLSTWLRHKAVDGRIKIWPATAPPPVYKYWQNGILVAGGFDMFNAATLDRMPADYQYFFDTMKDHPARLWSMGAVRYFLTTTEHISGLQRAGAGAFFEKLSFGVEQGRRRNTYIPSQNVPEDNWKLRVLEYTDALPVLRLVPSYDVFPDDEEADQRVVERLIAEDFNPAESALVQTHNDLPAGKAGGGSIVILEQDGPDLSLAVEASASALLVRAVKHHPHVKVTVDGQPAELLRVNYLFQGVLVPAGPHRVVFKYDPPQRGLIISLAGRICLLMALGVVFARGTFASMVRPQTEEGTDAESS